jgi:chromate transporter
MAETPHYRELAKLFLKLGIIGFGGPAVHIAMMEDEVVTRRRWLTREHFLDLIGATNLIPGPNSTEMAIHVGYAYAGLPGLALAGVCFIFPAVVITGFLAWIYVQFGTLPAFEPLLAGIKPAVLAIIGAALWRLGKKAIKKPHFLLIAALVVPLLLLGLNEVLSLLVGGIIGAVWLHWRKSALTKSDRTLTWLVTALNLSTILKPTTAIATAITPQVTPSLLQLGLFFLKVGAVLFGSGYVLIAFLEGGLVQDYGWLTQQQLLDAIAIGQFTPGPVLSTATFIGYIIAGIPGAIVATTAIFLPSFGFVAVVNPFIPKLRQSPLAGAFLDAVNVSAVALMAVVMLRLAWVTIFTPFSLVAAGIAGLAAIATFLFRLNSAWIVLGGAILGWLSHQLL